MHFRFTSIRFVHTLHECTLGRGGGADAAAPQNPQDLNDGTDALLFLDSFNNASPLSALRQNGTAPVVWEMSRLSTLSQNQTILCKHLLHTLHACITYLT